MSLLEAVIEGIGVDPDNSPLVLLRTTGREALIPIHIGPTEAVAIQTVLNSQASPRPLTHQLLMNALGAYDIRVVSATITRVVEGVFYAELKLQDGSGRESTIDARPSDAIALALRANAPIWIDEEVVGIGGLVSLEDGGSTPA